MISINLPNIVSVTIMAALGYVLVMLIAQVFLQRQTTPAASAVGGL
jgi:uncharacterized membrane protein YgaE (UPF0421/DUF939 family)